MPTLSIYLNNETYQKIQKNPSKNIQEAIEFFLENKEKFTEDEVLKNEK